MASRPEPRLDLSSGRLSVGGRDVPLTPTLLAMLRYFVLRPERLITKRELLDGVWPDTHVAEGSVKDYVRKIRRLLNEDPNHPHIIETVRGFGYRYLGGIELSGDEGATPATSGQPDGAPSVAVLPFVNLSGEDGQEHLADGVTEDIITALAKFRSLFVIASTSSFHYKGRPAKVQDVGRELGVAYIVEGSWRKTGDRARITAQLVEAESGRHIWAERYDRRVENIFDLQDEVVGKIVSTLVGQLDESGRQKIMRKRTEDLAVYDCLLLGYRDMREGSKAGILRARDLFRRAIDLGPESARACTALARSYIEELWSDWTTEPDRAAAQALDHARKAVAMDELDGRARVNLATALCWSRSDFEVAELHFQKGLALNPNDADGYCLKGWCHGLKGDIDEAIRCTEKAIELSPFDIYDCRMAQCAAFYAAHRYGEAMTALQSIPQPDTQKTALMAACLAQLRRVAEARQAMAVYLTKAGGEIAEFPGRDRNRWRQYWGRQIPYKNETDHEHLLGGLFKAGLGNL